MDHRFSTTRSWVVVCEISGGKKDHIWLFSASCQACSLPWTIRMLKLPAAVGTQWTPPYTWTIKFNCIFWCSWVGIACGPQFQFLPQWSMSSWRLGTTGLNNWYCCINIIIVGIIIIGRIKWDNFMQGARDLNSSHSLGSWSSQIPSPPKKYWSLPTSSLMLQNSNALFVLWPNGIFPLPKPLALAHALFNEKSQHHWGDKCTDNVFKTGERQIIRGASADGNGELP